LNIECPPTAPRLSEQSTAFVDVERRPPSVLPKVQIVKIDVERAEIDILGRMTSFGQTATCTGAR
jgi:hypothetical protein